MEPRVEWMSRIAKLAGRVFGIEMSAGYRGNRFVWLDDLGDPITDDGQEMVAATEAEIKDGTYAALLPIRALTAAGIAKMQELGRLQGAPTPPEAGPGPHL